jgi:hypothetical protein
LIHDSTVSLAVTNGALTNILSARAKSSDFCASVLTAFHHSKATNRPNEKNIVLWVEADRTEKTNKKKKIV